MFRVFILFLTSLLAIERGIDVPKGNLSPSSQLFIQESQPFYQEIDWQKVEDFPVYSVGLLYQEDVGTLQVRLDETYSIIGYNLKTNQTFVSHFSKASYHFYVRSGLIHQDAKNKLLNNLFLSLDREENLKEWRFLILLEKEESSNMDVLGLFTSNDMVEYLLHHGVIRENIRVRAEHLERGDNKVVLIKNKGQVALFKKKEKLDFYAAFDLSQSMKPQVDSIMNGNPHSVSAISFELLLANYAVKYDLFYEDFLTKWREEKKRILILPSGAHGELVLWLRSLGIEAFGIDLLAYEENSPYLFKGNAENIDQVLNAKGLSEVDIVISLNFLNYDYSNSNLELVLSESVLKNITHAIKKVLAPKGKIFFLTDHSIKNLDKSEDYQEHYYMLMNAFLQNGLIFERILRRSESITTYGAGLFVGRHTKDVNLNLLEEMKVFEQAI